MSQEFNIEDLVFLEDRFYQEGIKEGEASSQPISEIQGWLHGCEKGMELGKKLGFYQSICKTILILRDKKPELQNEKVIKIAKSIIKLIDDVPSYNDHELDYIQIVNQIESKVKLLFSLLGISKESTPLQNNKSNLSY